MNVKTHLVSLHRRYKNLEYHHHEQAEQSADITQRISHEARASVYSAAADDLKQIIDNVDDLPRNAKKARRCSEHRRACKGMMVF